MQNKPFWERLQEVLTSRRVLMALAGLLVALIVALVPALEAVQEELMTVIVSILLVVLGGLSARDAARLREVTQELDDEGNDLDDTDVDAQASPHTDEQQIDEEHYA